jgi:thioredoxin 1
LNGKNLITLIKPDNFGEEILEEKKPILLLCMLQTNEIREQIDVIEGISKMYGEKLKIGLIDAEFIEAFKQKFRIKGTPTFLLFVNGKEKSRMLGKGDQQTLKEFLSREL